MANCATARAHRRAQRKYVAKNPDAQRQRARAYYKKNATAIKKQKKADRKPGGSAGTHAGSRGRPVEC